MQNHKQLIEFLSKRQGADSKAVVAFLSNLMPSKYANSRHLTTESKRLRWKSATILAIREGIETICEPFA